MAAPAAIISGSGRPRRSCTTIAMAADVNSQADWDRVVKETESQLGPVTLLVANAALSDPAGPLYAIDPDVWQGFAFGFGIDRLAVMRYQLDDIRELANNDVRFLRQF